MTSCAEEMVLRIWGFWKDSSWDSIVEDGVVFSTVEACGWVFQISTDRDELGSKTPLDSPHVGVGSA